MTATSTPPMAGPSSSPSASSGPAIGRAPVAVIGAPAAVGIDAASLTAAQSKARKLAASIPTTAGAPMTATSTPPMAGPRRLMATNSVDPTSELAAKRRSSGTCAATTLT